MSIVQRSSSGYFGLGYTVPYGEKPNGYAVA